MLNEITNGLFLTLGIIGVVAVLLSMISSTILSIVDDWECPNKILLFSLNIIGTIIFTGLIFYFFPVRIVWILPALMYLIYVMEIFFFDEFHKSRKLYGYICLIIMLIYILIGLFTNISDIIIWWNQTI